MDIVILGLPLYYYIAMVAKVLVAFFVRAADRSLRDLR